MINIHSWFENIWWKSSKPPLWLRSIECIYSIISRNHLNQRASNSVASPLPLISVGNITAGGSGKTPFVLWLAEQLKHQGYKPVILCRGDGGNHKLAHQITKDDLASHVGDEAKMLAELSSCPVIAASDRIAGSRIAKKLGDIIILDDGFQYRHLQRCCDIVLIPQEGTGNGHGIPAGPLREPIIALARADIIIRTGSVAYKHIPLALSARAEHLWQTESIDLIDIMHSGSAIPHEVFAVCAIARPQRFFNDLKASGIKLVGSLTFPDHHAFKQREITNILRQHDNIAMTAKDAVKLQTLWPDNQALWVLQQHGVANPALISEIQSFLPRIKR